MRNNLMLEVMPYSKTASEGYTNKTIERIVTCVNESKNVSMLNIPEIVEENHIGMPYYRNVDIRKFGLALRERCKKDIVVNTVVVHYKSKEKFEQWLDETLDYGIKNFVFVGAKIPSIKYPGPSVTEANSITQEKGINFGNIFIPDRANEVDRLISKTSSGCKFFTSQVLFEVDTAINVINGYKERCKINNLKPAKFYLSFTPVSSEEDINFIKWLGAKISLEDENRLKNAKKIGEESIKLLLKLIEKISIFNNKNEIGLNIEYIMLHNLELAKELVDKIVII